MSPPKRGEIYKIQIHEAESVGHELKGHHWYVVMSAEVVSRLCGLVLAVPLTSPEHKDTGKPKFSTPDYRTFIIRIPEDQRITEPGEHNLTGDSLALVHQIRPLSLERFTNIRPSGRLTPLAISSVEGGMAYVLQIPPPGLHRSTTLASLKTQASQPQSATSRPGLPPAKKP